ncbi:MAG: threonine/serine exporter family protein [Veillonellales bacterium]
MLAMKVAAVFLMSAAIGILYRIPRSLLLYGALVGVFAWLIMYSTVQAGGNIILADFFGSVAVGVLAELLARLLKKPATIFIIPGFIPLVPGGEAYTTILYMVEGRYLDGVSMGMRTVLTGGAIAFGIFVSSTLYRLMINYKVEKRTCDAGKS